MRAGEGIDTASGGWGSSRELQQGGGVGIGVNWLGGGGPGGA